MPDGLTWRVPIATLEAGVGAYLRRVEQAAREAAQELADALAADAKVDAPWSDDSGRARAGLFAAVELGQALITVYLSHGPGVDYGRYLETRYAERYAVIWPTITTHLPGVWERIARRLA